MTPLGTLATSPLLEWSPPLLGALCLLTLWLQAAEDRDKVGMSKRHKNRQRISLLRIKANSGGCTAISLADYPKLEKKLASTSFVSRQQACVTGLQRAQKVQQIL